MSEPPQSQPIEILLVENNPGDAHVIQTHLAGAAHVLFTCHHVRRLEEVFEFLKTKKVDAILLNLSLPDSSGIDTVRAVHARYPTTPIVALTVDDEETIALATLEHGAQDYLVKGQISASSIQRTVRHAIERNKTRTILKESEVSLEKAQEIAHIGSWCYYIHHEDRMVWSKECCKIFGVDHDNVPGTLNDFFGRVYPEDLNAVKKINESVSHGGGPFKLDHRIVRPDGCVRWIFSTTEMIQDENGHPLKLMGIVQDITERKQSEDELLRLAGIVQNSEDAIYAKNFDGIILSWNQGAEKLYGYKPSEIIGQSFKILASPDQQDEVTNALNRIRNGGSIRDHETVRVRKNGMPIDVSITLSPLKDSKGVLYGASSIARDITEAKRAQEDHRKLEDQLRQSQKMEAIGQLAGGVAHDFNNILNIIMGYSDMLAQKLKADEENRQDVEEIRKAAKRAAALTHQLLAFSRRQALQPRVCNVNNEIEDLKNMLTRLLGENIHWQTSLAADIWPIKTDPGQLQQVIINLAVNARDAMPQGGTLSIKTENAIVDGSSTPSYIVPGAYMILTVSDTGDGMSEETKSRIFEPFFTTKNKGQGTGLGLSLVYGVIRQSNGFITVESALGKGSTFTVYLPKVEDTLPQEHSGAGPSRSSSHGTETILVVEDEETVQKLINRILSENGFNVLLARTGREALDLLEKFDGKLAMVLTDVVLPDFPGDEVVKQASAKYPELKIIFMSGYLDKHVGQFNLDETLAFLQKPFSADALTQKVRSVLDGPAAKSTL